MPTFGQACLAAGGLAEHLRAAAADDNGLSMAEHGGDGDTARALHILRIAKRQPQKKKKKPKKNQKNPQKTTKKEPKPNQKQTKIERKGPTEMQGKSHKVREAKTTTKEKKERGRDERI